MLLLVIQATTYSEMVPVMVGSKIIDRAMSVTTKGELAKVTMAWRRAYFGDVISQLLLLPHTGSSGTGVKEEVIHSSPGVDIVGVKEFSLDNVRGPVHTTQKITTPHSAP